MSSARRKRGGHPARRGVPVGAIGMHEGAAVYAGTAVQAVDVAGEPPGVVLGIGPPGKRPVAWVLMCAHGEGVPGLVADLQEVVAELGDAAGSMSG